MAQHKFGGIPFSVQVGSDKIIFDILPTLLQRLIVYKVCNALQKRLSKNHQIMPFKAIKVPAVPLLAHSVGRLRMSQNFAFLLTHQNTAPNTWT